MEFCDYLPSSLIPPCHRSLEHVSAFLSHFIDAEYSRWLTWLLVPLLIGFGIPLLVVLLLFFSTLFLHCYKLRYRLKEAYEQDLWEGARVSLSTFWDYQSRIWHGHEVEGFENIPETGPALIILYHATFPMDIYYLIAKCILFKKRTVRCISDRFLFRTPGMRLAMRVFLCMAGTVDSCVEHLRQGWMLAIAPGGVREACFSDPNNYNLIWGERTGFARIIQQVGPTVPVIPMFTRNCREAFRVPSMFREVLRRFYDRTKFPLIPMYGYFPVKLKTYLGKPLYFSKDTPVIEIRDKVKEAVEDLIRQHQILPGSIARGILERVLDPVEKKRTD